VVYATKAMPTLLVQEGRRQKAESRRQKAEGRKQKAEGKKACTVSFLTFFNWIVISAELV
jgi:hypothetical protein